MYLWVVYDIPATKRRNKVFRLCEDFALLHVQESVFVGMIDDNRYELFLQRLRAVVNVSQDKLYILPASKKTIQETLCLAGNFDKRMAVRDCLLFFI